MTKRTPSQSFIAEVTERIQKLHQISEESGVDLIKDLLKTLNQFSEISRNSSLDYSQSSDLDESLLVLQPTNSIFSIPNSSDLIATIRQKNIELEKNCTQKLIELRSTTKEFCAITLNSAKGCTFVEDSTIEKTVEGDSKRKSEVFKLNESDEVIQEELAKLKNQLAVATKQINESKLEIEKQQRESEFLQMQLQRILGSSNKPLPLPKLCDCLLF